MSILFTGGAGYIGSHCYYLFKERCEEEIVVIDNLSTGCRRLLPAGTCFYEGDVGSHALLDQVFQAHSIESVFHFAASISPAASFNDPNYYYKNNTFNTLALLNACVKYKVKQFIFSSTAAVYVPGSSVSEDSPLLSNNPYATSKRMAEMMIEDYHKVYGLNYILLRYFNVAGADASLRTGPINEEATDLIRTLCKTHLGQRDYLPLFGTDYATPDGTCIRDFIHVADLSQAHFDAYQYMKNTMKQQRSVGEIFNCGYGRGYSVKEVIQVFEKISQVPLPVKIMERRLGDPDISIANPGRLIEKTGWVPQYNTLSTLIGSALAWEKQRAEKLVEECSG